MTCSNPSNYADQGLYYDTADRLRQVPGGYLGSNLTRFFAYDAHGLRAFKQVGDVTAGRTYYLHDGTDPVQESGDEYGRKTNTFGVNGLVARTSNGLNVFYLFDWQGNVAHRLDANGNVLDSSMYSAYGSRVSTASLADPNGQAALARDPWGYKAQWGYYTDQETGLVLCTFRYYDPAAGRWLTRDPIGYDGGMNLYAYCGGDPVNFVDPWGLDANSFLKGLAKGVGGAVVGGLVIVGLGLIAPEVAIVGGIALGAIGTFQLVKGLSEQITGKDAVTGEWIPEDDLHEDYGDMIGGLLVAPLIASRFGGEKNKVSEIVLPPRKSGKNAFPKTRIAPFGNNTTSKWGRLPHYHYAVPHPDPKAAAKCIAAKGQGKDLHRPWEGGFGFRVRKK